jgi:predicted component of type VI protein secretion system
VEKIYASKPRKDLKFDWWIVQTEPVEITSTPVENSTPIENLTPVETPTPTEQPVIEQPTPVIEPSTETPAETPIENPATTPVQQPIQEPTLELAPPQASIEPQPTPEATAGEAMQ